jgi:hypothetical protein
MAGRRPRSLARLFWLLQENPEMGSRELAERLGVQRHVVRLYKWRLKRILNTVAYSKYPCPECFTFSVSPDPSGNLVCHSCGLVVEETPSLSKNLPFDETYAWVSHLAFNKSLGDTLPANRVGEVISRSRAGRRSLPARIQAAKAQAYSDPPPIRRLLETGSRLMKGLGLDADTSRNHLIADALGRRLRKAGALIHLGGFSVSSQGIARAALYLTLLRFGQADAERAREAYPFKPGHLEFVLLAERLGEDAGP